MATLTLLEGKALAAKAKAAKTKTDQTTKLCSTTGKDSAACKKLATTLAAQENEVTTADSDVTAQKKLMMTHIAEMLAA